VKKLIWILLVSCVAKGGAENVLFICTDDLRCDLGCYGNTEVVSPHVDALAGRGTLFERAYCQQTVCNPSRASFLTGRRPGTLEIHDLKVHLRDRLPEVVTLPQAFKNAGYTAINIGKIFHNWQTRLQGDPQSWSEPARFHWARHSEDWVTPGKPLGWPQPEKLDPVQRADVPDEAYFDGRIADAAVERLSRLAETGEKFFLAVGFWKPHLPFNAPGRYWDLYDRDQLRPPPNPAPPENVPEIAMHPWKELRNYRGMPKSGPLTTEQIAELRHGYYAAISYMDAQVGKLREALERHGLAESTHIVFTSDHGFHLGEHDLWCKTSLFELDARVPLLIVPAGSSRATRVTQPVELLDMYPTLLAMSGMGPDPHLEGRNLTSLLENPVADWEGAAYTQHPRPPYGKMTAMGCTVRTKGYRYTEWRGLANGEVVATEFYDAVRDPQETRNLAGSASLETARRKLQEVFPR
jgi:iduronate 2-sulfatase